MLDNINYSTGIDSAIKNIAEKPAQSIGTTFNDIWFLIFGGIDVYKRQHRGIRLYIVVPITKQMESAQIETVAQLPSRGIGCMMRIEKFIIIH